MSKRVWRRSPGGAPLVVVVSAPQLQLQFSTGNTVAGHWTQHLLTLSQFSTVKIALYSISYIYPPYILKCLGYNAV